MVGKMDKCSHIRNSFWDIKKNACFELRAGMNHVCIGGICYAMRQLLGGYDVQLQYGRLLAGKSCQILGDDGDSSPPILGEDGDSFRPVPRSLSEDPLIGHFNADDVHEAKELLDFLYEKAVLSNNEHRRKKELRAILRVKNIRDVDPRKQNGSRVHSKAYERLKTIVCTGGDIHFDDIPSDVQSWEYDMSNELARLDSNGTAAFPKEYQIWSDDSPFQRSQRSRLCFIHAPVLLISYIR